MSDKEYRLQLKRVKAAVDKWYRPIGLGWHQIDFEYFRTVCEEDSAIAASTECRWQYRTGWIKFYLPVIAELNDDKLENVVVHEFAHVLSWPLWENAGHAENKENEYATEEIARALIWAREAGKNERV